MMFELDVRLQQLLASQRYPFMFVTVSGAHLYGFPSPNSDWDLRGVHVLPPKELLGLNKPEETIEYSGDLDGLEADLVTHEANKFFKLLLKPNGYVLEQLMSPLVVHSTAEHAAVKGLFRQLITRYHAHHYLGFADTQWRLFEKETPRRVKPLLYVYRVLLTGIHLMRAGELEANLVNLNAVFKLSQIDDLVQRKLSGEEKQTLENVDLAFHEREFRRLVADLELSRDATFLPEKPSCQSALNDLLLSLRGL